MGKRYSLWDGNTKIGEIYEHDDPSARSDAKFAQEKLKEFEEQEERRKYREHLSRMRESHEKCKEKILAKMSGNDRVKYEQSISEFSKEEDRLICKAKYLKDKENNILVILKFLKSICTIFLSANCVFDVLKKVSQSNYGDILAEIFLISMLVIILRYVFGLLEKIAEKFNDWKRIKVINKLKDISYKIDTLVYSFSTEIPPSFLEWSDAYSEKFIF